MKNLRKLIGLLVVSVFALSVNGQTVKAETCDGNQVASTGENACHATMQDAVNAVKDNGGTITLLKSTTIDTYLKVDATQNVTLNLNGHDLTGSGDLTIMVFKGNLNITGTGKVINNNTSSQFGTIGIYGNDADTTDFSKITIGENVTVEGINPVVVMLNQNGTTQLVNYGSTVDIYGKLINNVLTTTAPAALSIHGNIKNANHAPVINIHEGAELKSTVEGGAGIYQAGNSKVTVNNAIVEGKTGIVTKAGTLDLEGATVRATGPKAAATPSSNGFNGTGAAIQIESNNGFYGNVDIKINKGTYESANNSVILEYVNATDPTKVSAIEVTDGEFTAPDDIDVINVSQSFKTQEFSKKFIKGGEFSSDVEDFIDTENLGQSESGQVGKLHNIKVEPFENGTVTVNKNAVAGEKVKIEAEPHDGYQVESIKVSKANGALVDLEDDEFEMPDEDVTITVVFAKKDITITLEIADKIDKEYKVKEGTTVEELLNELKKEHKSLTGFTDKDGKEIDLKTTITNGMYLKGVLTNEEITNPPKTADNILKITGLGIIGIGVLIVATKKYLLN